MSTNKCETKLNKGVFTFLRNRGLNIHQMRWLLKEYAREKGTPKPKRAKADWYEVISLEASNDFTYFKRMYNKLKDKISVSSDNGKDSYQAWYDECSMDGSFAYNGCTEDF